MKLLLTSNGINNPGIHNALVDLLGKPVAESNALFIPTAIYPFPGGVKMAWEAICGKTNARYCQIGWKSLGVLELSALSSIEKELWLGDIQKADALLVWGGDVGYLSYWMQQSGLAAELPSLMKRLVYVGMSAGSMATSASFGETYTNPPRGSITVAHSEKILFSTPEGETSKDLITLRGLGLVDFAIIPHFNHPDHADASEVNAEKWAAKISGPVYAIDDQSAIKVNGDKVEVVSAGQWRLFNA